MITRAFLITFFLLVGCNNLPSSLLDAQPTVRPSMERLIYLPCGWYPYEPISDRIVVDLALAENRDIDGITKETIGILQDAGGLIIARFSTNVVRLEINKANLSQFVVAVDTLAESAVTVTDYANFNVDLLVEYNRTIVNTDLASLKALDAHVIGQPINNSLYVVAPGFAIPEIKLLPGIRVLRARVRGCSPAAT